VLTEITCRLHSKKTNWTYFQHCVATILNTKPSSKTYDDITEAVEHFNNCIQQAAWNSVPMEPNINRDNYSSSVREMVKEKRLARRTWQRTRFLSDKKRLNSITKQLKCLLTQERNDGIQTLTTHMSKRRP